MYNNNNNNKNNNKNRNNSKERYIVPESEFWIFSKHVQEEAVEWTLPRTEQQETQFISFAGRFLFIHVLEIWILGTVKVFS
jgi:hypothetical protein